MIVVRPADAEQSTTAKSIVESGFAELRNVYVPRITASDDSGFSRVVAVYNGQVVGTVSYEIQSIKLHLRDFAVDVQHRRRGVGRALVQHLTLLASAAGCTAVSLYTVAQTGNIVIFERLGFSVVKMTPITWAYSPRGDELIEAFMKGRLRWRLSDASPKLCRQPLAHMTRQTIDAMLRRRRSMASV